MTWEIWFWNSDYIFGFLGSKNLLLDTYNPKYDKVQFDLSGVTWGQNMTFKRFKSDFRDMVLKFWLHFWIPWTQKPTTIYTHNQKYAEIQFDLSEVTGGQNMTVIPIPKRSYLGTSHKLQIEICNPFFYLWEVLAWHP